MAAVLPAALELPRGHRDPVLAIYEFPEPGPSATPYPKEFVIDYFRGYRRMAG